MFKDFNIDDMEAKNRSVSANSPKVVFFPLKPADGHKELNMLARVMPKYISMRLERFNKFEIFYVYFLNRNGAAESEVQISLPDNLSDDKFIDEYLTKLNIAYDVAFYGEIGRGPEGDINIKVNSYSKAAGKPSLVYSDCFKLNEINRGVGEISNKISLAADGEGECLTSDEHESLTRCETNSFEALYDYFEIMDALTLRNPYTPLADPLVEESLEALKGDSSFVYLIDSIVFICDDFLRFNMSGRAVQICDRAIEISASAYKLFLTKAKILLNANDYDGAFKTLRDCLDINPNVGDVAYNFGKLALSMQKIEDAKFAFNKMIECDYSVSSAYDNLGVMAAAEGDVDSAINFWHKAIEFEPSKVSAYTNLSRAYIELSDFAKAENYLQKARLLNPSYFMIYLNYYVLYKMQGNMEEAEKNYSIALEHNPDLALTDEIRAELKKMITLIDSGNENDALSVAANISEVTDKCWQSYFLSGIALRKLKRVDEAEHNFLKSAQINQKFADAQNELGLIYLSKVRLDDALILFTNAVSLAPANAGFMCNLGLCLIEMKNFERARNTFYKAKYLSPNDAKIDECMAFLNQKADAPEPPNSAGLKGFLNKIKNLFKK
ncbi:MAG: hypothetical protein A2008_12735 [Candidatus Wallbacteria bacterium GWC2_49_35]|uniref:Uncharacterized protein n=1 Tax=Candidatus Wallbacteria bacterium GWC2_49_35 TaxID=1817813 RepID=A0A1F7WIW2_9BACT|nr:MAG: hypothetical protein A2008_12735 [Candidatus Wallbacteria bacterium GWC2_49_35]